MPKRKPGPITEDSLKKLVEAISGATSTEQGSHAVAEAKLKELGAYVAWLVGEKRITPDQIVGRAEAKFQDIWPAIRARRQPG